MVTYRNFVVFLWVAFALCLRAQSSVETLSFSVASVKSVSRTPAGLSETDTRVRYGCISLKALMLRAFEINDYELAGLTGGSEFYEILATLPDGATRKDIPVMLRSLLRDRFSLTSHWEARPRHVYALLVDRNGLNVAHSQAISPQDSGDNADTQMRHTTYIPQAGLYHVDESTTFTEFAAQLTYRLDRQVIDKTGISGKFDVYLDAHVDAKGPLPPGLAAIEGEVKLRDGKVISGNAPPIFAAIRKLGLRLEPQELSVNTLVIDHVERKPTEN